MEENKKEAQEHRMKMKELIDDGNYIRGHVYEGRKHTEYFFCNTPEAIASFVGSRPMVDRMVLTDPMDNLVLNTIGFFIDRCPDKRLLERVKNILIPIQLGETPPPAIFCPSIDEVEAYFEQLESEHNWDMEF